MGQTNERGDPLPVPCRHCGRFLRYRITEGPVTMTCGSCSKATLVTARLKDDQWVITTAPVGNNNHGAMKRP